MGNRCFKLSEVLDLQNKWIWEKVGLQKRFLKLRNYQLALVVDTLNKWDARLRGVNSNTFYIYLDAKSYVVLMEFKFSMSLEFLEILFVPRKIVYP